MNPNPFGPVAPSFDEPLELLEACHGRIEHQLQTLEKLVPHLALKGWDAEAGEAARAVLRYFDTAGVLHHKDEDEDLFPLLRELSSAQGRDEIAAMIDELEREHVSMDSQWRRLRERLEAVAHARAPRLDPEEVTRFCWLYRRHMENEAGAVLPFAKQALDARQRAALGERMAARRRIG